jgi:branched-chain amino acid aminotransferase
VCEGSGENIYAVRHGKLITPPQTAGILDGISRNAILQIARDHGHEVEERNIARAELILADEVFLSGTAAELVPVREIDDHAIGDGEPGPVTKEIQQVFDDALHGRDQRYTHWLDYVKVPSKAA